MKLWVDDQLNDPDAPERHIPEGFVGVVSSAEAIAAVEVLGFPEFMDLDHDLGIRDGKEDDVMVFLKWLYSEFPDRPPPPYRVHSANGEGAKNIVSYLESWRRSLE